MSRSILGAVMWLAAACSSPAAGEGEGPGDAGREYDPFPVLPERSEGPDCDGVDVFLNGCAALFCHSNAPYPAAGLDLVSPGLASRLVNVPSGCDEVRYVVPEAPEESFLLEKLQRDPDRCGGPRMPLTGAKLIPEQIECVRDWIAAFAQ